MCWTAWAEQVAELDRYLDLAGRECIRIEKTILEQPVAGLKLAFDEALDVEGLDLHATGGLVGAGAEESGWVVPAVDEDRTVGVADVDFEEGVYG